VHWDDRAIARLEAHWGADKEGAFPCPLPGHQKHALLVGADGEPLADNAPYLGCCKGRRRPLGEAYAAQCAGVDNGRLSNKLIAIWTRRLAIDVGVLEPVPVPLPPLPGKASHEATLARLGFALLVGIRRLDCEPEPVMYSIRFCSAWCHLTYRQARVAIEELVEHQVIAIVERRGNSCTYEPGLIQTL